MLFDSWTGLLRVLLVGTAAYAALLLMLRFSGKRTLSKLNAFDFVVTVALGSTLATVLLSKDVSLSEGVAALALLVGLQFIATFIAVRSERFQNVLKAEPTLLLRRGEFLQDAMLRQRVTREEILAAMRSSGVSSPSDVDAVVLETDGSISVIQTKQNAQQRNPFGVEGPDAGDRAP